MIVTFEWAVHIVPCTSGHVVHEDDRSTRWQSLEHTAPHAGSVKTHTSPQNEVKVQMLGFVNTECHCDRRLRWVRSLSEQSSSHRGVLRCINSFT